MTANNRGLGGSTERGPRIGDFVTAREATQLLKVKPQTLYTYVSRGLVRSIGQSDSKEKLYLREDLTRLKQRGDPRAAYGASPDPAQRWGQPVIGTAITELTQDGPSYRGELAVDLARHGRSFEAVAELLWSGVQHAEPLVWETDPVPARLGMQLNTLAGGQSPRPMARIFALATTLLVAAEPTANELRRGTTIPAARQLILTLTGCLGYLARQSSFRLPRPDRSVAENAALALTGASDARIVRALNAAFIVCADHELSAATFAARIAASAGAELRECVVAALATHSGAALAGGCDRVEDLIAAAEDDGDLRARVAALERDGARAAGASAHVYPKGDPRARFLLGVARGLASPTERAQRAARFAADAEERLALKPSIEVGLVALCSALDLPPRSAGAIWTVGRCAGWIAHVMEQRLAGYELRPRGRYAAIA